LANNGFLPGWGNSPFEGAMLVNSGASAYIDGLI
jgi:hypothetical protein